MKIKTFDLGPDPNRRVGEPRIRVNTIGVITINTALCELLDLKHGSGVDFHQDLEEPRDWYISRNPQSKNKVRKKVRLNVVLFNNVRLAKEMIESTCPDLYSRSISFLVSKKISRIDGVQGDCFAIITSSIKKVDGKQ